MCKVVQMNNKHNTNYTKDEVQEIIDILFEKFILGKKLSKFILGYQFLLSEEPLRYQS